MNRENQAILGTVARVGLGLGLIGACVLRPIRHHPLLDKALSWAPLCWGLWAIGVVTLVAALSRLGWAWWKRERLAGDAPPDASGGSGAAARTGWRRFAPLWVDLAVTATLMAVGISAQSAWQRLTNPDRILAGYDYNTFVLNAAAVRSGEWTLFNPDKRVFHARLVGWLAGEGDLRESMVALSVVSIGLFPALTYVLGRRGGGRFAAGLAAALVFFVPLPWAYAYQTTSYPLFFALILASAAAVLWAMQRPSLHSAALAGLLAGAAEATQEKSAITLGPVLAIGFVLGAPRLCFLGGWRPPDPPLTGMRSSTTARSAPSGVPSGAAPRFVRVPPLRWVARNFVLTPLLALGLYLGVLHLAKPPRNYTPLVSLVTNQREEMHRELPHEWPLVKNPDVNDPAGLRTWLPRALWNGEIESWVAAALTPPDSNSLRLARDPTPNNPWTIAPNTSIAPVEVRLELSLRHLEDIDGPLPAPGALMVVLGTVSSLLLARGRRRQAVAVAGMIGVGLSALTLKFYANYFPQLVPVLAVLAVNGMDQLVRTALPGRWVWAGRLILTGIIGAYGLALWNDKADAWRAPTIPFPSPAAVGLNDPEGYGGNLQHVASWLADQPHAGAPGGAIGGPGGMIVDCVPGSMRMVMPTDRRISHELGDMPCRQGIQHAAPGQWLVASGHLEYRSPTTPDPAVLLQSGRWRTVYGWGEHKAIEPSSTTVSRSAVVVLEAVE